MSEEEAKAFLKKAGEDKELQEKLKGVDSEEKFFAVVKAAGFDFTKEEWVVLPQLDMNVKLNTPWEQLWEGQWLGLPPGSEWLEQER
jgi:predicted ribosomally synthesized peptide with nif11-like leader